MQVTISVTNCLDCPFKKDHRGHGECWAYCSHPDAPTNYDNILWGCAAYFKEIPSWCPLLEKQ